MKNKQKNDAMRFVIDNILVRHSSFQSATARIQRCYDGALNGSDPTCLAIIGESRTGKTRVLKAFEKMHPRSRTDNGLKVPVLLIKVQSKPTVKGLVEELLYALGDPLHGRRATENAKTRQLKTQLTNAETKLIALDEFQHFIDQGTHKIQHHVTDWLKMVVDDLNIGLVVAGLPSAMTVVKTNDQLLRRFMAPCILQRFNWLKTSEQSEFRSLLYSIQVNLKPFSMPDMESEDMALRIYVASGGLIGYVIKILREVTALAIDQKTTNITLNLLGQAYQLSIVDKIRDFGNPFTKSFCFTPTEASVQTVLNFDNNTSKTIEDLQNLDMSSVLSRS